MTPARPRHRSSTQTDRFLAASLSAGSDERSRLADDLALIERVLDHIADDLADASLKAVEGVLAEAGLRHNPAHAVRLREVLRDVAADAALTTLQARVQETASDPALVETLRITETRETLLTLLRAP
jgi:hypothetical protein